MRLGVNQRRCLHAAAAAVLATGAAWLVLHHGFPADPDAEPGGHRWERTLLAMHGAAAMAALVAFGMLLAAHVPAGLRGKRNRATGLALVTGALLLAATGHALYYFGDETWRPWIATLHWGLGLCLTPAFFAHRQRTAAARSDAGRTADEGVSTRTSRRRSAPPADAVAEKAAVPARRRRTTDRGRRADGRTES